MPGVKRAFGATRISAHKSSFRGWRLLLVVLLVPAVAALSFGAFQEEEAAAVHRTIPIRLALEPQREAEPLPTEIWKEYTVGPGDNLSLLFQRAGLSDADTYHLISGAEGSRALTRLHPGEKLGFRISSGGELEALRHQPSKLTSVVYRRQGDSYSVEKTVREPERRYNFASATIVSSLYLASQAADLSIKTTMNLANIFGGVIDFVLDPRRGDVFHVLYEDLYLDGEKIDDGRILAAEFINRGRSHTAYLYTDEEKNTGYFSETGVSMRRAFMLAPLDFTRVSSNFNPRRLHPIYKTTRPHRGTDYAAPRGTPVFAAGDGRVSETGYTRANGNYIFIRHGEQFTTKYLHLHKRKVKRGDRVKQRQVIGTVGSTGASTGPHLHYEFLINGVHHDPRTVHRKLPPPRSLDAGEMLHFERQTRHLRMQLAARSQIRTAQTETAEQAGSLL